MAKYDSLSRYSLDNGGKTASRAIPVRVDPTRVILYRIKPGDTLENLAFRTLGDCARYWELADLNPQIKYPTDLVPGTELRLPA